MYRKRPSRHDGLPVCEPRRAVQLLRLRTACSIVGLRGNVATRLLKLERGEADVTFLAAAGLERLGERGVGSPLESDQWLPAAEQGAIGIECLAENARVLELARKSVVWGKRVPGRVGPGVSRRIRKKKQK